MTTFALLFTGTVFGIIGWNLVLAYFIKTDDGTPVKYTIGEILIYTGERLTKTENRTQTLEP